MKSSGISAARALDIVRHTLDDGKGTLVGDVVDDLFPALAPALVWSSITHSLQTVQVCGIEGARKAIGGRAEPLLLEGDTERVEALTNEVLRCRFLVDLAVHHKHHWTHVNGRRRGPCVVRSQHSL
jgi:hypothetical protein